MNTAYKLPPQGWYRYRLDCIRRELAAGASVFEVARKWGMNYTSLMRILQRTKRTEAK